MSQNEADEGEYDFLDPHKLDRLMVYLQLSCKGPREAYCLLVAALVELETMPECGRNQSRQELADEVHHSILSVKIIDGTVQ